MSDALDVFLHGDRAGTLERRSQAKLSFAYAGEWVAAEGRRALGAPTQGAG